MKACVNSPNIHYVAYDETRMDMDIHFKNGQIMTYGNVPQNVYYSLIGSNNVSRTLDEKINPYFTHYRKA